MRRMMHRWQFRRTLRKLYGPESGITWLFHAEPGEFCKACTTMHDHYDSCTCGHCPPKSPPVIHRSLSEVFAEMERERAIPYPERVAALLAEYERKGQ